MSSDGTAVEVVCQAEAVCQLRHVTRSVAGDHDLGALDFQVFSAPVCTTASVDCDPN